MRESLPALPVVVVSGSDDPSRRKLDISENTAKIHVSAVLRALGVASRTQALIAANRLGLRLDA